MWLGSQPFRFFGRASVVIDLINSNVGFFDLDDTTYSVSFLVVGTGNGVSRCDQEGAVSVRRSGQSNYVFSPGAVFSVRKLGQRPRS